jgi:hypothetical protein
VPFFFFSSRRKISGLAIHQALQTCFDTAATDERGADWPVFSNVARAQK